MENAALPMGDLLTDKACARLQEVKEPEQDQERESKINETGKRKKKKGPQGFGSCSAPVGSREAVNLEAEDRDGMTPMALAADNG